jgi:hypothetical protein
MKTKSMLLVEVCHCNIDGKELFKRRIADNYDVIEDWIMNNARIWALGEVNIECDDYVCGKIRRADSADTIFVFKTTNIGFLS